MSEKPLARNPLTRLLILTPLLLSGAAAVLLLALTPLSWGKADALGIASWAPAAGLLLVALPVLFMCAWGVKEVHHRATGLFDVDMTWAVLGAVSHWLAALSLVIFGGTATSAASYESLGVDSTSTGGFIFLVILFVILLGGLLAGMTGAYVWSVTPGPQTRIGERRDDEVDFVNDWTRRRPHRRP
jgi:hypothetical protein